MTLAFVLATTLCMGLLGLVSAAANCASRRLATLERVVAAGTALFSLSMLASRGQAVTLSITWLPGLEAARLSYSSPGIPLAVIAFVSLALTQSTQAERPPPGKRHVWPTGWAHMMCTLTVLALTVDQFLVRYVLLELVALGTLFALIQTLPLETRLAAFPRLYLPFRLGDAGLLAAILLLQALSGSFEIDTMLQRGALASRWQVMPIAAGALLAVWVKVGRPPFHAWLAKSSALPWRQRVWIAALGLPLLGAYLLYRIKPVLAAAGLLVPLMVAGALLLLLAALKGYRADGETARSTWWFVGHSALGLVLFGTGALTPYLISFVPLRAFLCFLLGRRAIHITAEVPDQRPRLEATLERLGRWANTVETGALEAGNAGLIALLWALVHRAQLLEKRGLDALGAGLVHSANSLARQLRGWHQGKLRQHLLWATCAMMALIALLLVLE